AEAGLGDRVTSALELAIAFPAVSGAEMASDHPYPDDVETDERADLAFVRRQRADALAALRRVPITLFRPRFSRRPGVAALLAAALLVPAVLLPNPQDTVIAHNRAVRDEATKQATKVEEVAK